MDAWQERWSWYVVRCLSYQPDHAGNIGLVLLISLTMVRFKGIFSMIVIFAGSMLDKCLGMRVFAFVWCQSAAAVY